jgi:hypothetical protein
MIGVSEVLAAFIIIALMIEAASTSETSVNFARPHGTTYQNTTIFIRQVHRKDFVIKIIKWKHSYVAKEQHF